jgi:murein tripeptide amidase MpaA
MWISSAFDSGNILVDRIDGDTADLRIRADAGDQFFQWFHFTAAGTPGRAQTLRLMNAHQASFPKGWEGYQAVASYDLQTWFRVATEFDGTNLTITHTPEAPLVTYAYFAPYPMARHRELIARCTATGRVGYEVVGETVDGQPIEVLRIGDWHMDKLPVWVIGRQHPGESMAEWWMEGFLERLLDTDDPSPTYLLDRCVFYVVPNMNPDGTRRGHLRTNAAGVNLNRMWQAPDPETSPEVYHVRRRMYKTSCSVLLDVHGEEVLPHNFIAGFEGIPNLRSEQLQMVELFKQRLLELNPDFQTSQGYPPAKPGHANLGIATPFMAESFGAVAMTLEMPFKDSLDSPHPAEGWSPARSRMLGRSCLNALRPVVDRMRGED